MNCLSHLIERVLRPRQVRVEDPFAPHVTGNEISAAFDAMEHVRYRTWLVVTRNPARMRTYLDIWEISGVWNSPGHIWVGVPVSTEADLDLVDELIETPARTRFVEMMAEVPLGHRALCPDCGGGIVRNCRPCRGTGRAVHHVMRHGKMEELS